ncbi:phenylalanine--tRNA ligase subunit beta [Lentisphaera profundi]|uniref:Phenylalanine--tRNA ligase beta subunit n=1 Tax=Lentisphaera profundi TaxID=1658616 RepID=A0ABY7VXS6_9BACT|nr:phenylalanine--tRNA ligase subunit beta [Lentisphaera profundi]WDE98084.1 phenylalanine--tRNA ligase subunit beta [Lentisphaera profundi]
MKISLNWIKEFVDYKLDRKAQALGDFISLSVAEVEEVEEIGAALAQVKAVKVLSCAPHPEADRLQLATINTGSEERTIVCGASNCRPGITVPFADLGAKLPITDKEGKPTILEIKKAKIRGFESTGMLCSEAELGLADSAEGILEMDESIAAGTYLNTLAQYAGMEDIVFEIDNKSLTHRPDLWGHYGFAREFSAMFDLDLKPYPGQKIDLADNGFSIAIDSDDCRRYSSLRIKNVKVEDSPQCLQDRLSKSGINPINNIVDLTNLLLLELGQPMHAFDVNKCKATDILVRNAQSGESFKALDENDYTLSEEDMVISIGGQAEALAGVIGGDSSSIDENSNEILIECASFNASAVRRSATRHGIRTDSSSRFEKSLDPENTPLALARIWQLIKELCPQAELVGGMGDLFTQAYPDKSIDTSIEFIEKALGCAVGADFITSRLARLGFAIEGNLKLAIPSWRNTKDIAIQEDIVEEIGRLYGFDNITPETLNTEDKVPQANQARILERRFKDILSNGYGFSEIMTYPWCGKDELKAFGLSSEGLMKLINPVSEDATYMKPHNMPKIIKAISENLKHYNSVKLYDFNRIYDTSQMIKELLPTERVQFCGALVPAPAGKKNLQTEAFYELKSTVSNLLKVAGINTWQLSEYKDAPEWVHPGISCQFRRGRVVLAEIFKLHPAVAEQNKIKSNAYLFCINFDELAKSKRKLKYEQISKFPAVPFDITVQAPKKALAGDIQGLIRKGGGKSLVDLEVFSVYERDEDKTVSFRMHFAAKDHTLVHDEIHQLQRNVVAAILKGKYEIPNLPDDLK